jgi:hypothetical protein
MNTEFINYEQAVALKELGFDEPCFGYYDHQIKKLDTISSEVCERLCKLGKHTAYIKAPTFSQAFRFLYKELGRDGFGIMPIDIDKCNKELNMLIEIVKDKN